MFLSIVEPQWLLRSPAIHVLNLRLLIQKHWHWAPSTEIWRFSCSVFQFCNQSVADGRLLSAHHFGKKSLVLCPALYSHYRESGLCHRRNRLRENFIYINSHNNTMRYIISSKKNSVLCCKKWNSPVLITAQQMPHKSAGQGSFCTSDQAYWMAAGWLLMAAIVLCTRLRNYCLTAISCFVRRSKSFLKPCNLIWKTGTLRK